MGLTTSVRKPTSEVSTLNSVDALAMVEHGSEMTINITTPVGTTFRISANFIGTHSDTMVMIEPPVMSEDDLANYFQEGFWVNVRAISPRGEGAVVHFRAQIEHVIHDPLPYIAMSVPRTMKVQQLRKEPRYDVNLVGRVRSENQQAECEVRDLSKGGCRFITTPLARPYQVGDSVEITFLMPQGKQKQFAPLYGRVCNLQRSSFHARYGVQFDDKGRENAKFLLANLKFNGSKLTLR
ncbi:flagellar brake protein [Vibrio agarivorans]|uniref:flagellar brake protein n=1 Tax=Vibrio agarivorans TaxID=153622 RepID=UPI002230BFE0|nr:flagellar brake protein [Vibrio agarivorans]MDN3660890.1 flagellar brake protein [Vibrio agarivorans]